MTINADLIGLVLKYQISENELVFHAAKSHYLMLF